MQILVEVKCKIIKTVACNWLFSPQIEACVKAILFTDTGTAKLEIVLLTGTVCEKEDALKNAVK